MLSGFGYNGVTIAFPLLMLATTRSAAASGIVLGTIAATQLAAGLPAGALADRWNLKYIMLGCEPTQAAAAASLVVAFMRHDVTIPHVIVVAGLIGACTALFGPAKTRRCPTWCKNARCLRRWR